MNKEQYLIKLIYNTLKNSDNQTRHQAENQLISIRDSNPNDFFMKCAQMIHDINMDEFIRISCSTIISRSLSSQQQKQVLWDKISLQYKEEIKNLLMGTLIQKKMSVMRAVAHAISCIAAIELVRNQWINLCDILAQTTINSDPNIRNASVTTIGYICQQLRTTRTVLNTRIIEQFMGGIIASSNDQMIEIRKTALIALRNSMQIIAPLLNNSQIRYRIVDIMLAGINNDEMRQEAYMAFQQFVKFGYQYLGDHMGNICEFIHRHLNPKNQTSQQALQLIDTIGTEFLQRVQSNQNRITLKNDAANLNNYLIHHQNELLSEIMRCFLIENPDDLANPELRNSANKCLGSMVACGNQSTIETIINGVNAMVNSNNLGFQQASAPMLSAICEYSNQQAAIHYIRSNIEPVLGLLNSNQLIVVSNSISGLSVIAQYFPQIFYHHQFIKEIINKLFTLYHDSKQHQQHSKISLSILIFFKNLTEGFNQQQPNILLSDPDLMFKIIVREYQNTLNNTQLQNIGSTQELISIILNFEHNLNSNSHIPVITEFAEFIICRIFDFFHKGHKKYEIVINNLLLILQIALFRFHQFHGNDNEHLMRKVCQLLDTYIKNQGVQQGGLQLLSALSLGFQKSFGNRVSQYWPYIFDGLKMINHPSILKAVLETIGDLGRCYSQKYLQEFSQCMKQLFPLINLQIDRNLKIKIIQTIGDLFLGLGYKGEEFIDNLLNLTDVIFDAVFQLSSYPQEKQYMELLEIAIIDTFSCAVFSLFTSQYMNTHFNNDKYQKFSQHFQKIVHFVKITSQKIHQPTVAYVKRCLELINDLTGFLIQFQKRKTKILETFEDQQIRQLVDLLDKFNVRDDIRELQQTIRSQIY